MEILMVCHRIPWPLNEGGTIAIYNNLKGYAELGHNVTLLALNARKHRIDLKKAKNALSPFCQFDSVPINTGISPFKAFLNLFTNTSYNVERFYSRKFDRKLKDLLTSNTYDLIQVEGTYAAPYAPTVLKYRSGKVILRQHNAEYQIWQRLADYSGNMLKKWYLRLLSQRLYQFEKSIVNQFDAVVPITVDDKQRFRDMGCTVPIHVAPAGIDTDLWKVDNGATKRHKLYHLGSLEWRPNLDAVQWMLGKVWPLVQDGNSGIELHIAGKGMPEDLRKHQLKGVYMEGQVEDAKAFVREKDICIVPLSSGSGIRVKILEAMAAGKPVISTTIGAQGIAYENGRNILIADTPEDFAKAILELVQDEELYDKLAREGRDCVISLYSNVAVVRGMIDFVMKLDGT